MWEILKVLILDSLIPAIKVYLFYFFLRMILYGGKSPDSIDVNQIDIFDNNLNENGEMLDEYNVHDNIPAGCCALM